MSGRLGGGWVEVEGGKAAIWDDWLFYVGDYAGWSGLGGAQRADSWLFGILVLLPRDGGCAYCGITAAIGARQG